ncbi:MAG: hypothetical protein FWH35_02590 [Treponema sp.]|nr:hypothetical protein [Treponema sp.]
MTKYIRIVLLLSLLSSISLYAENNEIQASIAKLLEHGFANKLNFPRLTEYTPLADKILQKKNPHNPSPPLFFP